MMQSNSTAPNASVSSIKCEAAVSCVSVGSGSGATGVGLIGGDNSHPRTLYVGNLDPSITEELILALFTPMGPVNGCKIIHDNSSNDPYCFVEFGDHNAAATALHTMNKRVCLGKELKVNWATSPGNTGPKQDTSKHYHIFIGDLSPEIETAQLKEAFSPFGEVSDCRVVRDPQTLKSKGYGFVSFVKKTDAENAITTMNGQWLGTRAIRTNWATRKPPSTRGGANSVDMGMGNMNSLSRQMTFDEVYQQSSPTNCTVYCGGIMSGLSDELIQKTFAPFGPIQEIRVFKDKGYAFIKFATKEAATNAIVATHNADVFGQTVKCSWGKESGDPNMSQVHQTGSTVAAQSLCYPYQQMAGYWYPQSYPQLGAGQFAVQTGMQYPYGQYYTSAAGATASFNATAAAAAIGMQMAWQTGAGIPNTGQPHHLAAATHQSPLGPTLQQPAMIGAYPMQPYQAQ